MSPCESMAFLAPAQPLNFACRWAARGTLSRVASVAVAGT